MKCRFFLFLPMLFFATDSFSQQQPQSQKTKPKYQVWEFMTRNTMTMKVIAKRFHVDEKIIKKLSKYRKKKVYPATVLRIPVLVRESVWNPENYNPNQPILPAEDSRTAFEYEWNSDKLDPQLKEDFIILREVKEDSAQLKKLHLHLSSLDKSITIATKKLDSIKATEFSFKYDSADINSVLAKMQRARDNYYAMSPIGREVDSLNEVKNLLGEESQRIQNRLNEFEYLSENANYYQATKGGDRAEVDTWTKRVIAETKYEAPSITPKPVASNIPSKPKPVVTASVDTAKKMPVPKPVVVETPPKPPVLQSVVAENKPPDEKPVVEENKPSVAKPTVVESKPPVPQPKIEAKTDSMKKVVVRASATDTLAAKTPVHIRSNYAWTMTPDTLSEEQKRALALKQQIEKVKTARKHYAADDDFLEKYELRNHPNVTGISISPIKTEMEKDRPKYEIAADVNDIRKAEAYLVQFREAVKNNNLKEALPFLLKAIDANPHNANAWSWHAELQAAAGHSEDAIKEFTIAQTIARKNARPFYKLGLLYDFSNNSGKADEYYRKAIQADSSFAKTYFVHTKLLQKTGNMADALKDYNTLLKLRPAYIEGYKERAQLKSQMKDYTGAIDDYSVYLEMAVPDGETLYRRGMARIFASDFTGACADFNAAKKKNNSDATRAIELFCK